MCSGWACLFSSRSRGQYGIVRATRVVYCLDGHHMPFIEPYVVGQIILERSPRLLCPCNWIDLEPVWFDC